MVVFVSGDGPEDREESMESIRFTVYTLPNGVPVIMRERTIVIPPKKRNGQAMRVVEAKTMGVRVSPAPHRGALRA
jgi:hypothetical protein